MSRAGNCFRPSLDEFERKTLLSAGQLSHQATALHAAVPSFPDYKIYLDVFNDTGKALEKGAVTWRVDSSGKILDGFNQKALGVRENREFKIVTPVLTSGTAQLFLYLNGKEVPTSWTTHELGRPFPGMIAKTYLK